MSRTIQEKDYSKRDWWRGSGSGVIAFGKAHFPVSPAFLSGAWMTPDSSRPDLLFPGNDEGAGE